MVRFMNFTRQKGFSLVEISVVLAIIGLIIGGGVSSYNAYIDNAYQNSTEAKLEQTKRALLDYVMVNYHMPCPDTNDDGLENREGDGTCTASKGFVPYDDIGRSRTDSSDDWNNVFAYGVNNQVDAALDVASDDNMAFLENVDDTQEMEGMNEASYFANQTVLSTADTNKSSVSVGNSVSLTMPLFSLRTPVTSGDSVSTSSYKICKRDASSCSSASDYEVQSIPAVLVAFNENGNGVSLASCGGTLQARETENCDGDLDLWRGTFSDKAADFYDDQIVTISAYEIKQQVLDRLNQFTLNSGDGDGGSDWECYNTIINEEFSNANQLNISTTSGNAYLVTKNMTLSGNFGLKAGDDIMGVLGTVGTIDGKAGDDLVIVSEDVYSGLSGFQTVAGEVSNVEYICHYEDLNSCYDVAADSLVNPNDSGYETLKALVTSIDPDQNCGLGAGGSGDEGTGDEGTGDDDYSQYTNKGLCEGNNGVWIKIGPVGFCYAPNFP